MTHALYINAEHKALLLAALDLYLERVTLTSRQRSELVYLRSQTEFCTRREQPHATLFTSRTPKTVAGAPRARGANRRANDRTAGA